MTMRITDISNSDVVNKYLFYRDEDNSKFEFAEMFADELTQLPKRIHAFAHTYNGANYGVVSI